MCGEFPAQMASNVENISIWWRHHAPSDSVTGVVYSDITNTDFAGMETKL